MSMTRWGVWTENDGGFVTDVCHSEAEAAGIRDDMIATDRARDGIAVAADTAADLSVIRMCDDHDDQPHAGCETCDAEDNCEACEYATDGDNDAMPGGTLYEHTCGKED